jgi:hypothetical protein
VNINETSGAETDIGMLPLDMIVNQGRLSVTNSISSWRGCELQRRIVRLERVAIFDRQMADKTACAASWGTPPMIGYFAPQEHPSKALHDLSAFGLEGFAFKVP